MKDIHTVTIADENDSTTPSNSTLRVDPIFDDVHGFEGAIVELRHNGPGVALTLRHFLTPNRMDDLATELRGIVMMGERLREDKS